MKKTPCKILERYRVRKGALASDESYGMNGFFVIPYKTKLIKVMSSDQQGWDHVSVSLEHRIPTWDEMCYIKNLFFDPDETVIQFHPAFKDYINVHPYVLHMWRKHGFEYPMPPKEMI